MAVTNAYCTLDQVRSSLGINDTMDDTYLTLCVNAASRSIDKYVGRKFWVDTLVTTRSFFADDAYCLTVEEGISTTTGLIVQTDPGGDGTFDTTLVLNTDFLLRPVNAASVYPAEPYTEIFSINGILPILTNGRPGVQVTAKFGWPAVPDDITLACVLLAKDNAKSKDAPFGVAGASDFGILRIRRNQTVVDLLSPFKPALVA